MDPEKNVWEVDTIYPLVENIKNKSNTQKEYDAVVAVQAFRAIHKIISDGNLYKDLNTRRKEYIRKFYKTFFNKLIELGIEYNSDLIYELSNMNADLNPWYQELKDYIENVVAEFSIRRDAFYNDRSIKHRGVAQ